MKSTTYLINNYKNTIEMNTATIPSLYTHLNGSLKYTQLNSLEICDISSFNIRIERIIILTYPEKKATI